MKKSEIKFNIELDEENLPEKIFWSATDAPMVGLEETKAITISLWDGNSKDTMRIDLWTKEMPVDEMKKFYIDTIAGLAASLRTSTGDNVMSDQIEVLCDNLVRHVKNSNQQNS